MKSAEEKVRFVELRAAGQSYAAIAATLGICKQTTINWSKELQTEVSNLRTIHVDAMQRRLCLNQEARLEMLGGLLETLNAELAKRDLSSIPTDKIFDKIIKVSATVASENVELRFKKAEAMSIDTMMANLSTTTTEWSA